MPRICDATCQGGVEVFSFALLVTIEYAKEHSSLVHIGWCPSERLEGEPGGEDGRCVFQWDSLKGTFSHQWDDCYEFNVRDADATVIVTVAPRIVEHELLIARSSIIQCNKPWLHLHLVEIAGQSAPALFSRGFRSRATAEGRRLLTFDDADGELDPLFVHSV